MRQSLPLTFYVENHICTLRCGDIMDNKNNGQKNQANKPVQEDINELKRVRREKLKELVEKGKDPFNEVRFDRTSTAAELKSDPEGNVGKIVAIAGRIMSKRVMGKASFCHISDNGTLIQLYVAIDCLGEEAYAAFKKTDIGDIVGASGEVFITQRGELSVRVKTMTLLSKSLTPLPEKWHGLKDNDLRYRNRSVDLLVNPEVKDAFITRSKIISALRAYLDGKGFLEVETPILNTASGGASARPFITHHNTLDIDMYMRIALELNLKRLIIGGMDKVYEIGRVFRNEGMDIKHNPEFTELEMYEAYSDYTDMMKHVENMYDYVRGVLNLGEVIEYQGTQINLKTPWKKISMRDAVKEVTGVDFASLDDEKARAELTRLGVHADNLNNLTKGECLYKAFDELVEKTLIQPTFIYDYPIEVSPLAKRKPDDPKTVYRFEFFINGGEYGNSFSELNDPIDQKARFAYQAQKKAQGDSEAEDGDDDFVEAMEYGMPPTGGLGIGVDRMIMLFTNSSTIRDVILFPTMKPVK